MAEAIQAAQVEKGTRNLDTATGRSPEGWVAGALIAVMLISVTGSVAAANWADGVSLTLYSAITGMLFGALVARLRLPGWLAHPIMLLEGAFATAFFTSSLVQPQWATWNEKLLIMELRLGRWASAVFSGGIGTDTLLFVMLLVALAWVIGYVAAWSVFRNHQPWGAILPAGGALLLNLFYAPPQSGIFLMAFLLSAMLLLVRTTLLKREEAWKRRSVHYASDIGFDFLTYGIVFSGLVILTSWLVPPTAPGPEWVSGITDRVRGPWQDASDNIARMFSTVRNVNTGGPTTLFGASLAMGGPIRLGNRPVADIKASTGRYWRAVVFDKYTGVGWVSTASQSDSYAADDPRLQGAPVGLSRAVTQTVQVLLPGSNFVIAASEPQKVSEPVDAHYSLVHSSGNLVYQDVASLRLQRTPRAGDTYTVVSAVSGADVEALRAAQVVIPADIRARYLQLPKTVPARVRDLAIKITADASNNYDKATALEQYLRTHIKYDESVAQPPSDRDAVDYTLFDRPAGYCNYYASAMAVMAREIGIPARVVSGFANGDAQSGVYHLNEANAHTWVELYFGSLGWIQFEPTASKPEITRPVKQAATPTTTDAPITPDPAERIRPLRPREATDNTPDASQGFGFNFRLPRGPLGVAIVGLIVATFLALLSLGIIQLLWNRRMRGLAPGARAWEEMYRFANWAGYRERDYATPHERAGELIRVLPDARVQIGLVADLYVRERYSARPLSAEEGEQARVHSRGLRRRVLRGVGERAWNEGPVRLYRVVAGETERIVKRVSSINASQS